MHIHINHIAEYLIYLRNETPACVHSHHSQLQSISHNETPARAPLHNSSICIAIWAISMCISTNHTSSTLTIKCCGRMLTSAINNLFLFHNKLLQAAMPAIPTINSFTSSFTINWCERWCAPSPLPTLSIPRCCNGWIDRIGISQALELLSSEYDIWWLPKPPQPKTSFKRSSKQQLQP